MEDNNSLLRINMDASKWALTCTDSNSLHKTTHMEDSIITIHSEVSHRARIHMVNSNRVKIRLVNRVRIHMDKLHNSTIHMAIAIFTVKAATTIHMVEVVTTILMEEMVPVLSKMGNILQNKCQFLQNFSSKINCLS